MPYPLAAARGGHTRNPAAGNGLLNNLVAYWGLDEAGGANNALDKHTNGLTLTQQTSPGSATGLVYAGARTLVGGEDWGFERFDRVAGSDFSGADVDFSFAAWVYVTTLRSWTHYICQSGDDEHGYFLQQNGSQQFRFCVGTGTAQVVVTASNYGTIQTNTWIFIVCWHDAANDQIGIQVDNGTANTAAHSAGVAAGDIDLFVVGSRPNGWYSPTCRIGPVCAWRSTGGGGGVLSAAQKTALYNSGNGLAYASFTT